MIVIWSVCLCYVASSYDILRYGWLWFSMACYMIPCHTVSRGMLLLLSKSSTSARSSLLEVVFEAFVFCRRGSVIHTHTHTHTHTHAQLVRRGAWYMGESLSLRLATRTSSQFSSFSRT